MNTFRGAADDDDDPEELFLDRPDISKELADMIRGGRFSSEVELLQYLLREKPGDLKFGREHYLESRTLEEYMTGLSLKLKIHGYDDRGERLKYLYSTLRCKFADKEEIFKILAQFLMDMSVRPTAVTHLEISTAQYSPTPDEENSIDQEDSEKEKELLKQILLEHDAEEYVNLQYSSGSDLSEWSTDEEESLTEKSNNSIPPIGKIRTSSSFGEFSDLPKDVLDPEALKQEIKLHWMQERSKAQAFFNKEIRKFDVVALTSQPVISSVLVLQSRFGEFWEWKRSPKQKSELMVAFEEDVVREILWQFVISDPTSSPVFADAWVVKPNLILATLSKSSFSALVNKFGCALLKLQCLHKFTDSVGKASTKCSNEELSPSKIYRSYASGLQQVFCYITSQINALERELKNTRRDTREKTEPACTTLIRLESRTRPIIAVINILYEIHSRSVPSEGESVEPWFASIKLISCFETYLLLETKPKLYGVLLFFYSRCLHALLDDFISTLKTLKWDERYSLFIRDPYVRLNDSNFWADCIKVREYKELLQGCGISSLMCLNNLVPKVLNILKTCEVLDQLEEDFTKILSKSSFEANTVIDEFLAARLPPTDNFTSEVKSKTEDSIGYLKHFHYIGLGNSLAAGALRFLTSPKPAFPTTGVKRSYTCEDFVNLPAIPFEAHSVTLEKVLFKLVTPFCHSAKENIQSIFQNYKVIESMTVFQEIILAVREDFARTIIEIASDSKRSEEYVYEDSLNRNPKFQKLLNDCYPEGRDNFAIELKLDSASDMKYTFMVTPYFPLNLIITPQSVAGYLFIGTQLHRIRKSLWDVSSLHMNDCRPTEGVDATRLLMFRFCIINFCSSIRSFFTLKLFSKEFRDFAKSATYEDDLDSLRRIHEEYLESIRTRMLRNPLIENIIIRKIVAMSEHLKKSWTTGISQKTMLILEDTLKKCWQVVNDFESTKYSFDFNELSHHFGPPPTCLTHT